MSSCLGLFTQEDIWAPLPSLVFGVVAVLSGSLVFLLPETKGTSMPDTVEEAIAIAKLVDDWCSVKIACVNI